MPRLALVLLVVACGGKPLGDPCSSDDSCKSGICRRGTCRSGEAGTDCAYDGQCQKDAGLHCFEDVCQELGNTGAKCTLDRHCKAHLGCHDNACLSAIKVEAHREARRRQESVENEARVRQHRAEEEARLLAESGVVADGKLEHATNPPGPGSRVRVVKTTAKNRAFAACRPDERVIGGGCKSDTETKASYPSEHSDQDTVGARWNCEVAPVADVTAYALCAKLP